MTVRSILAYHAKYGNFRTVLSLLDVKYTPATCARGLPLHWAGFHQGKTSLSQCWMGSSVMSSTTAEKVLVELPGVSTPSGLTSSTNSALLPRPAATWAQQKSTTSSIPVRTHCQEFLTANWGEQATSVTPENETITSVEQDVYALVILNTNCCGDSFERLWSVTKFHICADGGANRLYDMVFELAMKRGENPEEMVKKYVPDVIKGDLDSLRPEVGQFYQGLGTKVIKDPDQNCNDFYKALSELRSLQLAQCPQSRMTVMALGAFGGRFDQEMASINALYEWDQVFERLLLLSEQNLGFLLSPGKHRVVPNTLVEGPTCGLLPVGGACRSVSTKGLKWDLKDQVLRFGGLVSSSNCLAGDIVEVQTRDPLLWMSEIRPESWAELAANCKNAELDMPATAQSKSSTP
eukprot:CAMPEP_0113936874 /NCGR_PEP_ID=MMETSP1339-20121228/3633_1 /TAXON_ID=94617 /ORGANISM="Fibrocapsa japonica" /LENGTH=406 /DNA_ID=CAMNT_0000939443 /DNA_START=179 /DNA_END=1399 /DNA_ORIENTATION=+ /assembly_acc=CAM_ASM_000762